MNFKIFIGFPVVVIDDFNGDVLLSFSFFKLDNFVNMVKIFTRNGL